MAAGHAHLRLHKPPILSTASVAWLEEIGRVDGDSAAGVEEGGEMVPGAQSRRLTAMGGLKRSGLVGAGVRAHLFWKRWQRRAAPGVELPHAGTFSL